MMLQFESDYYNYKKILEALDHPVGLKLNIGQLNMLKLRKQEEEEKEEQKSIHEINNVNIPRKKRNKDRDTKSLPFKDETPHSYIMNDLNSPWSKSVIINKKRNPI